MISIAVVEDDDSYANTLQDYLRKYEEEYREMVEITRFSDGDEIVENYRSQFDIILMDIEMQCMKTAKNCLIFCI